MTGKLEGFAGPARDHERRDMAELNAKKRNRLPDSAFALPEQRKYPIDTPTRARNALARAAQNATPAEQAQIKRKVAARYPSIEVSGRKGSPKRK